MNKNLILRVSIEFFSFLKQNFVLMFCKLQRHEIQLKFYLQIK